jgi:hypothetical protein
MVVPHAFLVLLLMWESFHFMMTLGAFRNYLRTDRRLRPHSNTVIAVLLMIGHVMIAMFVLSRLSSSFS